MKEELIRKNMTEIENKPGDVFDFEEVGSLFEPVTEEEPNEPTNLFESKETSEPKKEIKEENEDLISDTLFDTNSDKKKRQTNESIDFSEIVDLLSDNDENFLVFEGEEGVEPTYDKEKFLDLYKQNLQVNGEKIAEAVLDAAIQKLSPTMQKLITGELQGVSVADIVKDLEDYQDVESLPEYPTDIQKEKIVKNYYKRIAKERGKDSEWVAKKIETIIDRGELDSEFEDAKDIILLDIDKKQAEKAKEIQKKEQEKQQFKSYHAHYVNEALKEDNIFGLKLNKSEKEQIAQVLATFAVRPTDKKEKLGLTALIDSYIHSNNPKETYKRLALMSLAATAPDKLIEKLKNVGATESTEKTILTLKNRQRTPNTVIEKNKNFTNKPIGSVF